MNAQLRFVAGLRVTALDSLCCRPSLLDRVTVNYNDKRLLLNKLARVSVSGPLEVFCGHTFSVCCMCSWQDRVV